ncbi:hypothetical protein TNCV_680651 [Trichonephila clavipes]|nr:hypothetical protein TNCV_680651 [Trichonephila clavipes]
MEYCRPGTPSVKKFKTLMPATKCKTALQCPNAERHGKTEIHSVSTTILQPRFGTVGILAVPKIEDVERSMSFNGCQSPGSRAQMDTLSTRIFLHGRNEEIDRTIEQMSHLINILSDR